MQELILCSKPVPYGDITDKQTVIIQYDDPKDLNYIKGYVRSRRNSNATSFINQFIEVDCFVEMNISQYAKVLPQNDWVRVVYHCTKGYGNPMKILSRYPGAMILQLDTNYLRRELTSDRAGDVFELSNQSRRTPNIW